MIDNFLDEIIRTYRAGDATEHSYRAPLQKLFESLNSEVTVTNEAKRTEAGSPDFTFRRRDRTLGSLTIGYCECKGIGKLGLKNGKLVFSQDYSAEQFERYLEAFPNLLYTDGFTWVFFRDHDARPAHTVVIAEDMMGVQTKPEAYEQLETLLKDFVAQTPKSITSSKDLAARMAAKAKLIRYVFNNTLKRDPDFRSALGTQYTVFKEKLIHDITPEDFAGIYAETIAYGLFAARLQDRKTPEDFSREEAYQLLPKSIPFLRNLFQFIARGDLDDQLVWVIDDLVEIFLVSHPWEIMEHYGKSTARNDPFLHFYEDFLAAYDPKKRKARGVWYTPEPVVDFIIRAVDDVLKEEFGLPLGLADTSKVQIEVEQQRGLTTKGKLAKRAEKKIEEVHRVQILDPAAGTGTFLAHAIKHIASTVKSQIGPGAWDRYVEADLIPRLHGFELLMASYAMCHLKLDMELKATGYNPTPHPPRATVYLTNSLEEGEPPQPVLMLERWLADEAREANRIKTEKPIMCVIGNPPYSGISQNMGEWITGMIEDYKYVDGVHFGERKHWLHDDYVKFIRLAEHMIEENGEGVLGFITNHGYLDNPTFRGMRWHLLKTFDKIYVLDLHGNAKKKEVSPDGSPDKNVFDIQQGVAIIIGVKRKGAAHEGELAQVFHSDLWGMRTAKHEALYSRNLFADRGAVLQPSRNYFMFYPISQRVIEHYERGFAVDAFFCMQSTGIISARDDLTIAFRESENRERLKQFVDIGISDEEARTRFLSSSKAGKYPKGDSRGWALTEKRPVLREKFPHIELREILYRPFDKRSVIYDDDIVDWPRRDIMGTFDPTTNNVALLTPRMTSDAFSPLVSKFVISNKTASRYDQSYFLPLYLYPDENELDQTRRVNFDPKLYAEMRERAGLGEASDAVAEAIFDYIYGVLHCPAYRETYAEFLKIDFPRIPWPTSPEMFRDISAKGHQLRRLHLMEPEAIGAARYPLHGEGDMEVARGYPKFVPGAGGLGEVFINEHQRFIGAREMSWNFWIGGYQPAQKWLKDRRERTLSTDDLIHYQRILKILSETDRIMKTIEMPLGEAPA